MEGDTGGGLDNLVSTVITVAAIALGVLVGAGLQWRSRLSISEPAPAAAPTAPDPAAGAAESAAGR
ncbi:hypothetical protein [Streptomyces sp. NBC_00572]|uniref:hypothetical protein n=1 Tax=Streptomyces sp. NBC_00572 TaxID=2903664 RepID=UPI00224FB521|nr:hypothetical protein [Streptomyces sp. NBC_00572]MCX4985590.1 hypothetical protein [Streptomyces sp. NBC_00572]